MNIKDIIQKKRDKKELTEEEMKFFIISYFRDEIMEEQAAALLTLIYTNGITKKEMAYLTNAMAETGQECELYRISNQIVDIHPIGGIEDKVVIMVMCIIAALDIPIAKISGRELGLEDRMISIPNYKTRVSFEELRSMIENTNIGIMAEPIDIAPVEEKMYRLRNTIACNDDISLITMSIMSQKLAIGARNVIFDITYGENAYVKTYNDAKKMANYFIDIGNNVDRNIKCIISKMEEPIGGYFGNILEINEIKEALNGEMTEDMAEMLFSFGNMILKMLKIVNSEREAKRLILNTIKTGKAISAFSNFLEYQGIDMNSINEVKKAKYEVPIISNVQGYVKGIDVSKIRNTALFLNAIKRRKDDNLDIGSGIKFCKKIGDKVEVGEIIAIVYTNDETKITKAINVISDSYSFQEKRILNKGRILGVIE